MHGLAPARLGEGQCTPRDDVLVSVTLSGCSLPRNCRVSQSCGADPLTCKLESRTLTKPKVPRRACADVHWDNTVRRRTDYFCLPQRQTQPGRAVHEPVYGQLAGRRAPAIRSLPKLP